jgi:hypothetical protein
MKVMKFESKRGPKKKRKKKKHFVSWKAYFFSCYFSTLNFQCFPLHFEDDF